jgi:hypothetical protein
MQNEKCRTDKFILHFSFCLLHCSYFFASSAGSSFFF